MRERLTPEERRERMQHWQGHFRTRYGRHRPPWMRPSSAGAKRSFIFWRLGGFLLLISLLVAVSMLAVFSLLGGGLEHGALASAAWLGGCLAAMFIPLLGVWLVTRVIRSFAFPLAEVMTAADAVAEGDLSVRVSARASGEIGRLGASFNRMAEELERAEERRRNLTADIAHELRTPLHIIRGNLEGILDGVYEPDRQQIENILDETQLLARLIDDLHTLSLAESGRLQLHYSQVDVGDLIQDVATSFSVQAELAGVRLTALNPDGPAMSIEADADRLDQILSNLVTNAIRHTPPGGEIRLEWRGDGERVTLVVSDSGEGIPPEELPYIFERFWRADAARSRGEQSGSGLGLAIVEQLVQMHAGSIQVSSQPGEGTLFEITLPRLAPGRQDAAQAGGETGRS